MRAVLGGHVGGARGPTDAPDWGPHQPCRWGGKSTPNWGLRHPPHSHPKTAGRAEDWGVNLGGSFGVLAGGELDPLEQRGVRGQSSRCSVRSWGVCRPRPTGWHWGLTRVMTLAGERTFDGAQRAHSARPSPHGAGREANPTPAPGRPPCRTGATGNVGFERERGGCGGLRGGVEGARNPCWRWRRVRLGNRPAMPGRIDQ